MIFFREKKNEILNQNQTVINHIRNLKTKQNQTIDYYITIIKQKQKLLFSSFSFIINVNICMNIRFILEIEWGRKIFIFNPI